MKQQLIVLCLLMLSWGQTTPLQAQRLSLSDCEKAFQQNNLVLLSGQLGISVADAQIVQSKIWPQPVLIGELNAYNPQNNRAFDVGNSGQKALTIQELIRMGGKRKYDIAYAQQNKEYAILEFENLLRSLQFELHREYYTLAIEEQNQRKLSDQLAHIDTLLTNYFKQVNKGNVSSKDLIRLTSLQIQLKNEYLESNVRLLEAQKNMRLLTGQQEIIHPDLSLSELNTTLTKTLLPEENALIEQALSSNTEYRLTNQQMVLSQSALSVAKAARVPDLTMGASYDQRGGAFGNQVNLTFQIPLPIWNSNKGNIQKATLETKQAEVASNYKAEELKSAVRAAVQSFQNNQEQLLVVSQYSSINPDEVYTGVLQNFKNGNISLLEFTDFMESYNHNIILVNNLTLQTILSLEELNFLTNQKHT